MNKQQFLDDLRRELHPLPQKEKEELLEDYASHFVFGLEQGKSEEEIAEELGNPSELAKDAMNEFFRSQSNIHVSTMKRRSNVFLSSIGLFLLNFVLAVIPLGLTIWITWISLFIAAIAIGLAPFVAVFDFIYNSYFNLGLLFVSVIGCGISIFLVKGCHYIGKLLKSVTLSYYQWNIKVLKGD